MNEILDIQLNESEVRLLCEERWQYIKLLLVERQSMLEYMNEEVGTEHLPEEWQLEGGER